MFWRHDFKDDILCISSFKCECQILSKCPKKQEQEIMNVSVPNLNTNLMSLTVYATRLECKPTTNNYTSSVFTQEFGIWFVKGRGQSANTRLLQQLKMQTSWFKSIDLMLMSPPFVPPPLPPSFSPTVYYSAKIFQFYFGNKNKRVTEWHHIINQYV